MLLILLGFIVGAIGTLIGVGGGFMLIPLLLFIFPEQGSVWIASVSMWVVACNATSGSIAYFRRGTIHLRAAAVFILASLPGSVLGVWIEHFVSRAAFELIFGIAVILYALVLFFKETPADSHSGLNAKSPLTLRFYLQGAFISFFVGFIASFFGIGGGVVHVPLLSHVLGFPVHLATGTSHMILAVTAWFTAAVHLYNGDLDIRDPVIWCLGAGAIGGAQVGAYYSRRVSGRIIMKILAVALIMVGIRLILPTLK
jgi:uncharacterized membrane protein YfcA